MRDHEGNLLMMWP